MKPASRGSRLRDLILPCRPAREWAGSGSRRRIRIFGENLTTGTVAREGYWQPGVMVTVTPATVSVPVRVRLALGLASTAYRGPVEAEHYQASATDSE